MARAKDVEGSAKVPLPEPFLSFHKQQNSLLHHDDGDVQTRIKYYRTMLVLGISPLRGGGGGFPVTKSKC